MYRTYTYVAGDWDGDKEVIEKLYSWNNSDYWGLTFKDAHDLKQAKDSSLNCNIKRSLKDRLDVSKTFVLVVGDKTNNLTAGGCQLCGSYNSFIKYCVRHYSVDYRSFIKYECDVAYNDIGKIIVIYNGTSIKKENCPEVLRNIGKHLPAYYWENGKLYWNYEKIKDAMMN